MQVVQDRLDSILEKTLDQLTEGGKMAIILCASAFRYGGNWGFVRREDPNFRQILELMAEEKPNVKIIRVSNGAIVLCNEKFLAHNMNLALPNLIDTEYINKMKRRREEEKEKFIKFIERVLEGKSRFVERTQDGKGYELHLGIFSVNDTNAIRLNNIEYPAYKLNLIETLEFIRFVNKQGKNVYVKAVTEEGKVVFDLVERLAYNSRGLAAIYRGIEISDTMTGAFLTLRIVG